MTLNPDTLAAAVKAYIDWQYRERGATRFTLTDLRAALLRSEAGGEGLSLDAEVDAVAGALDQLDRLLAESHPNDDCGLCESSNAIWRAWSRFILAYRAPLAPSPEAPSRGLSTREFAYQQATGHASPEYVADLEEARRRAGGE